MRCTPCLLAAGLGGAVLLAGTSMLHAQDTPRAAVAATARVAAGSVAADPFQVDGTHSVTVFRIRHMDVSLFYGTFHEMSGSFNVDMENLGASMIDVEVKASSVSTGNPTRDDHLRNPDFFNVREFPSITFTADSFRRSGPDKVIATGELTFLGVTKEIDVDITKVGEGETRQGYKQGIEARFTIKRTDFGNTTYVEQKALGDEVEIIVALAGARG